MGGAAGGQLADGPPALAQPPATRPPAARGCLLRLGLAGHGAFFLQHALSSLQHALSSARTLLYGDATWQHSTGQGRKAAARSAAPRLLLTRCTGAVSTGTFNREFYVSHGMRLRASGQADARQTLNSFTKARADRSATGRPGTSLRIGFAGKLIPRKGAGELVRGFAAAPGVRMVADLGGRQRQTAEVRLAGTGRRVRRRWQAHFSRFRPHQ